MKFLSHKNAFTLIELIVSLLISSILFFIVFTFIANNSFEVSNWTYKINVYEQLFQFRDKLNRFIIWWYVDLWTIQLKENHVLYLKDAYNTEGVLFWVVNAETLRLQSEYKYWNYVLWYRLISDIEIAEIESDNSVVYSYDFFKTNLYNWLKTKDFNAELYNSWSILDVYMWILPYYFEENDGLSFSWNPFLYNDLYEFNLNF